MCKQRDTMSGCVHNGILGLQLNQMVHDIQSISICKCSLSSVALRI